MKFVEGRTVKKKKFEDSLQVSRNFWIIFVSTILSVIPKFQEIANS